MVKKNSKQENEIKENEVIQETQEVNENDLPEIPDVVEENKADESQASMEEAKDDAQEAQENENAESPFVSGADMYAKHAASVDGAKQFHQCKLPSISYYSKRALCDSIDNMKRMCDRSKGFECLDMCVEMLEMAIAYLYNRKLNG
jgi:hypothetical protein|nr:MAG TPA: hypothetical protein [Caudoviricetes sp.]